MKVPAKRSLMLLVLGALIVVALAMGFRDPPLLVDTAEVVQGDFRITLEEEGRTRVVDRYQVTAPVSGYLNRVVLEPGDIINPEETLFIINPLPIGPLDARHQAQAQAQLSRADAALQAAHALVEGEQARSVLARQELDRIRTLVKGGHLPSENLDRAEAESRRASATLRSARFSVDVAAHERAAAEAMLISPGETHASRPLVVRSPVAATLLKRPRQSEGTVQAGEPIVVLGDLHSLEIEVDVLSPDAVRLTAGMKVELERWGGEQTLTGRVRRIEPAGFTRISALGVEEQRVWVIIDLDDDRDNWQSLGDGYRIEARFILWQGEDVLQIPASALFRQGDQWGLFVMKNDRAYHRQVTPGRRSGLYAEILDGLSPGEQVILHPDQAITDGARVRLR